MGYIATRRRRARLAASAESRKPQSSSLAVLYMHIPHLSNSKIYDSKAPQSSLMRALLNSRYEVVAHRFSLMSSVACASFVPAPDGWFLSSAVSQGYC